MNYLKLISGVFALSLAPSFLHAQEKTVVMEGTTSYVRDRDDRGELLPEGQRGYKPLPNVRVTAFRKSVIGTDTSRIDMTDATYQLKVAEGPEFHVLFHEDRFVPTLKTLTTDQTKPTTDHKKKKQINVTLLTRRQFEEIFGREKLVADLKKITRLLRDTEGVGQDEIKRLKVVFRNQFDVDVSEK